MKNNYNSLSKRNTYFKSLMFFFTVIGILAVQRTQAQVLYKMEGDSQVKVAVDSTKNNFTAMSGSSELSAEGNFVIKNGLLEDISAFKLMLPIQSSDVLGNIVNKDSIDFKLTHVMVLPMMRLIHIVGEMNVGGVTSRTDLDFSFVVNEDQSISLFGTKSIKLSDYKKEDKFNSSVLKESKEVKLSLNLLLKNDQQRLAAVSSN